MSQVNNNRKQLAILASFCCFLWASATPVVKIAYEELQVQSGDVMTMLLMVGTRCFFGGLMIIGFFSARQRRLVRPKSATMFWKIVGLSMVQSVFQYSLYYIGMSRSTGVRATIMCAGSSFWAILLATLIFRTEKLSVGKLCGCLVGISGIVLINSGGDLLGPVTLLGEGSILMATMLFSLASIFVRKMAEEESTMVISGYQLFTGGAVLMAVSVLSGTGFRQVTPLGIACIIYLAMNSGVSYVIWSALLKKYDVSSVTCYKLTEPIFGVILSVILLGEGSKVSWPKCILALVLVCSGIYAVNRPAKQKERIA